MAIVLLLLIFANDRERHGKLAQHKSHPRNRHTQHYEDTAV